METTNCYFKSSFLLKMNKLNNDQPSYCNDKYRLCDQLRWLMENQRVLLFLNRLLANYFVLHTKWYRYQWFAKGSHVFMLKKLFKQFQQSWQEDIENIAAHILYLNGKPFATMIKFIKEASLEEAEADDLEEEMFAQIQKDLRQIIREIEEEGIPLAKKADDTFTIFFLYQLQLTIRNILNTCHDISFD